MEIALGCCSNVIRGLPHVAVLAPETPPHSKRIEVRPHGPSTRIKLSPEMRMFTFWQSVAKKTT